MIELWQQLQNESPHWFLIVLAPSVAFAAAAMFYPARHLGPQIRSVTWVALFIVVAISPSLIPVAFSPLRFVASLFSIELLVKLYDLYMQPELTQRMSLRTYLTYLPNAFWLVLRRTPDRVSVTHDLRRLAWAVPAAMLSIVICVGLWQIDWSAVTFVVEHAVKVSSIILTVVMIANVFSAVFRLLGGRAIDFMGNPIAARTPADFWRQWNRPAQQFLDEYVFAPAGGHRAATRATLVTFAVSGLLHEYAFGIAAGRISGFQIIFFLIQGCAVVLTFYNRPNGRTLPFWIAGTLMFNLTTSMLFFQSVNSLIPFYYPRTL